MQILDSRPQDLHVLAKDITNEAFMEIPSAQRPLSVFVSCYVNKENFGLVKQALIQHTVLDMKVASLTLTELGAPKVVSLLALVEVSTIWLFLKS